MKLIRYKNILIICITQVLSYYFLSPLIGINDILSSRFLLLISATFLSAAAGYIINDYMDAKLDMVNKPNAVIIGKSISRRWAILLHSVFNILAVYLAWQISYRVAGLVFTCSLLLWMYSQYFKKSYLLGNLLVALMTASTIFILIPFDENTNISAGIAYSLFAFFSNLIREIIKDTEDMRGDSKFNAKTLPIKLGTRKTKTILIYLQILFIASCIFLVYLFPIISFTNDSYFISFCVYMLIFVIIPSIYSLYLIWKADTKKHFTKLSFISKLIMIFGVISMIFWRIL
ncbi:MAG: geranylgeranylglycerol-phosphate geranylgeranyltransferase [Bacteroidia bacterium]|nr:geranylgeranylglycerol-phosphate geranylgeranyltransferase [Bacteroidia bacterium]